jgi:Tol biopolymer transport system component
MPGMAILGVLSALALVIPGGADETTLVSREDGASGAKAQIEHVLDGSMDGVISTDGRYVAFSSEAPNLVDGDDNDQSDVFVRDLETHRNVLVSRRDGRRGEIGDGSSSEIAISGDGRSVAFTTQATNLSDEAPASYFPILVRDLRRNRTLYASRASGARGAGANASSYAPALSGDGRVVAFHSDASNLDPADRGERADVYVRDLRTNRTTLVSRADGARGAHGNGASEGASISADGRYVAFVSRARNLHPDDTDGRRDVFVRDLRRNVTRLVSQGPGEALEASISADGRHVAFVYRRDSLLPEDGNPYRDVYLSDLRTGDLALVTVGSNGRSTYEPEVSADGRYVAFESNATNLDPLDTDTSLDVFVRDMTTATTRLVSRSADAKAAGPERFYSDAGGVTRDGQVVFDSTATNLHPDDTDEFDDVYVR